MARRPKNKAVMVNLEEPIHRAMAQLTAQLDVSFSAYCRNLIIDDLRARGILPDRILAELYVT